MNMDPTWALAGVEGINALKGLGGKEKTSYGEWMRNVGTAGMAQGAIGSFWQQQQELLRPILGMQAMGAIQAGSRARQTLEARLGAMGLGGAGMAEMARAFGSTFAAQQVAGARLQAFTDALSRASEMGMQTQLANLEAFTRVRQSELGKGK